MRVVWLCAALLVTAARPANAACEPTLRLTGPDRGLLGAVAKHLGGHGVRVSIAAADDGDEWGCVAHEVVIGGAIGDIEVSATDPRGERASRRLRTPETAAAWLESWIASAVDGDRPGDASGWSLSLRMELGGGNDTSTSLGPALTLSRALGRALELGLTLRGQTGWMDLREGDGTVQPLARGSFDAVLTLALRHELDAVNLYYGIGGGVRALFGRFNNAVPVVEPGITALVPLTTFLAGEVRWTVQLMVPDGPDTATPREWINGRIALGLRWTLP